MELLRNLAGIVLLLCFCKLSYELASLIGSKAKFYERFSKALIKFKGRRKI